MTERRDLVGYLGFSSRGNLGDDAIELALSRALPNAAFTSLPLYPKELASFLRSGDVRVTRSARLLLGGGTIIGRRNWRVHLDVAGRLVKTRPMIMVGAGVEDPAFQGVHSFSSGEELARWRRRLLRDFDQVSVRGPRSAALLAGIEVEAAVVGDPALLLDADPLRRPVEGLLGVNLGWGDDLWGHDPARVQAEVAEAIRTLSSQGWRVRILVVNEADRAYSLACAALAGCASEVMTAVHPDDYLSAVAECDVLVAERLHAAILGVAAAVPTVMLEYQPKCLDFMGSVGAEESSLRTDTVTAGDIVERVQGLHADRDGQSRDLAGQVERLRQAQRTQLATAFGTQNVADAAFDGAR